MSYPEETTGVPWSVIPAIEGIENAAARARRDAPIDDLAELGGTAIERQVAGVAKRLVLSALLAVGGEEADLYLDRRANFGGWPCRLTMRPSTTLGGFGETIGESRAPDRGMVDGRRR